MVGIPWTDKNVDLAFMQEKLPEFSTIHSQSVARRKNQLKNAFLERVYQEYEQQFPGRMDTWELAEVGTGGTEKKRKEKIIKVSNLLLAKKKYSPLD